MMAAGMKKTLLPFALIAAIVVVLIVCVWLYERAYGLDGSFGVRRSRIPDKPAEETVMPK